MIINVEGAEETQKEYQKKIADIETNRMYAWADMTKIKKDLWSKLHQVKSAVKDGANYLAQLM